MKKKLIFFGGPMNKDTSEQYMENGQKLHANNMRFSDKGGAAQDIIGNSEVVNAGLPAGVNICVHAHSQGNYIFYFIFNINDDHQIWRYDYGTGVFDLILQDDYLGFNIIDYISCRQIGDLLYWTDGYFDSYGIISGSGAGHHPPRKLNIEKSILYQSSGGSDPDGYPSMDVQTMDLIKWPPAVKPSTEYQTDTTRKSNELYQKLFQFTYRYIYDDHETSVWSQYSKMILPDNVEGFDGRKYYDPETDNTIQITIDTGHHTVKKIQIAARVGNFGNFGIFKTIDKAIEGLSDDVSHNVDFYGDEAVEIVDNQTLRNYDTVPHSAKYLESVNGNTLVLGNMIEGFDKVATDASVSNSYRKIDSTSSYVMEGVIRRKWIVDSTDNIPPFDPANHFWTLLNGGGFDFLLQFETDINGDTFLGLGLEYFIMIDPTNLPSAGTVVTVLWRPDGGSSLNAFYYSAVPGDSDADTFGQNLAAFLDSQIVPDCDYVTYGSSFYDDNVFSTNGYNYIRVGFQDLDFFDDSTWVTINGAPATDPTTESLHEIYFEYLKDVDNITSTFARRSRSWKWGSHHPIGIVYTDRAKRDGTVNTQDEMRAYVPFPSEVDLTSEGVLNDTPYINVLKFSIDHTPPEWAERYHFVYQGNSRVLNFQHRMVIKAELYNDNRIMFSLDNVYEDRYKGADISHQIKKGDIIRVLTTETDSVDFYPLPFSTDYWEFNVLEYLPDGGEDGAEAVITEVFDIEDAIGGFEAFMIEIYTPRDSSEEALWFEIGDDYEITATGTHQGASFRDQEVLSIDASAGEVVVVGDYGYLTLNGSITISDSVNGNDGNYTVTSSSYDIDANETTITINTTFPGSDDVVDTGVLCGGSQDQVLNLGFEAVAAGYLEEGDCYYRVRPQATGFTSAADSVIAWVQDFHYSDYYTSNWYNKGRPMVFDVNARKEVRTGLFRNSQKYLDNTLINGLSTFYGLDQAQVQENFGVVYGMVQVGQTLKYFQQNKVGSIYIGQEEITNADGTKQLITTNKVLGTIRPHEEPYGCVDPLSIQKVDRDVFFYDRDKSVFCKATPGGIIELSNLGMRTWFRDKKDDFNANTVVMCVHDRRNNEVLLVFTTRTEYAAYIGRTALGFNYEKNEFTGFQDIGVEMLVGYEDDRLFSWKNGVMYRHDDGEVREFYGAKVEAEMSFVFNEGPDRIKTMKGISMNTDRGLILEEVEVLPSTAYPNGMMSRIKKESFKAKEGGMFADYRRDMNDPNYTNGTLALVSGRELRGYVVIHKLVISDDVTERVTLQNVTIHYHESGN